MFAPFAMWLANHAIFGPIIGFLKTLPRKVWYFLAGVALFLFAWHLHSGWERTAHDAAYNEGYAVLRPAYDKQQRSIADLQMIIRMKNAESDRRAAAYADSKTGDAADNRANDAKQRADAGRSETLRAIAKAASDHPGCPVPSVLATQLEGL